MLAPAIHAERRQRLASKVSNPILLMGNGDRARNLPMATVPFRQDSTFLYLTGCTIPGAALLINNGTSTLYLPVPPTDDALWHGTSQTIEEMGAVLGFTKVKPARQLEEDSGRLSNIVTLAVPDLYQTLRAQNIVGQPLEFGKNNGSTELIETIISMRQILDANEIAELRQTIKVTHAAHIAAMGITRPGIHERDVAAAFHHVVERVGLQTAYSSIVTVQGEILHNFRYVNTAQDGQLLLLDGGAEASSGYATDITRTWPVSGAFDARQQGAYGAVLAAQKAAIDKVRSGTRYREVHRTASRVLAEYLVDEGLLRCTVDDSLETSAHAIFFPHGVGHLLGLDVHDMENFGDRVGYPHGRQRSTQFGTAYLRLDTDLQPGMCVTVEPGFYVIPSILNDPRLQEQFAGLVDFEKARSWIGFGGIRIEDDVLVTTGDPDVLSSAIPKEIIELEALIGVHESPAPL